MKNKKSRNNILQTQIAQKINQKDNIEKEALNFWQDQFSIKTKSSNSDFSCDINSCDINSCQIDPEPITQVNSDNKNIKISEKFILLQQKLIKLRELL